MRQIKKLLPDEYYLDKNFFPLAEKIRVKLIKSGYYDNVPVILLGDIVFDVLTMIKPRYHQLKRRREK